MCVVLLSCIVLYCIALSYILFIRAGGKIKDLVCSLSDIKEWHAM
jgi:hypothetical protein